MSETLISYLSDFLISDIKKFLLINLLFNSRLLKKRCSSKRNKICKMVYMPIIKIIMSCL